MPFDTKLFMRDKFRPRTAEVSLPDLADWFGEGESPVWVVRSLDATELARAEEAASKNSRIKSLVEALDGLSQSDRVAELRDSLGLTDNAPAVLVKRLEHLVMGSVEPKITLDVAVKLASVRPVEFYQLADQIMALTGKGQEAEKKRSGSGGINESKTC